MQMMRVIRRTVQGSVRGRARQSAQGSFLALVLLAAASIGCNDGVPAVMIVTPVTGSFTTAPTVQVQGVVLNVDPAVIADVRVNGVSVLPLAAGTFTTTVTLDTVAVVNPIVAEVIGNSGTVLRDRVTVIAGDSIADGDFSLDGIALRLTEAGLDEIEPQVKSLVPLDLAALVPPGTLIVDNFCYQDSFLGCIGRVDATISGSPPPSISDFAIDIDPMTNQVAADVTLFDLFLRANVFAVTGIGFSCTLDVSSATTVIMADYELSPDALDPSVVDVTQLGPVNVSFGGFNDSTNCGGFLGFIVEAFIGLFISDLQNDFVKPGLEDFLNATDPAGNTPIAAAIEVALNAVEIAGPIGEAIGVSLEAPLFDITEDTGGVTLGSDARITASMPDPNAVDLLASYHVDQAFPTFGPLAPNGQPYDLAMCISGSAFNQLLKAEVESGLLLASVTELDFGSGPIQLTAGLLAVLLPSFGVLDPAELLRFDIRPGAAPFVTGEPGPSGELATLRLADLQVTVVPDADPSVILAELSVDGALGLDADFVAGELAFLVTPPEPEDISFTVIENPLHVDEVLVSSLVPQLLSLAIPALSSSLGSFPFPDFLGLQLSLVDVDRNGEFISVFLDLAPAP